MTSTPLCCLGRFQGWKGRLSLSAWLSRSHQQRHYATSTTVAEQPCIDLPMDYIRNFSIIAHVDHGKSTLADRLLEITGAISPSPQNAQVLDKLKVERERGITIKAQTASLYYSHSDGQNYLLNLIDTPGHVDFSYEVSRSLAACQGALLVVDATRGIQAQTVAHFWLAFSQGLAILPILNKIDLPGADTEKVERQLESSFEISRDRVIQISAKSGLHVHRILPRIISDIPPPAGSRRNPFRSLLFDSWFDVYRGVVCHLAVKDGSLSKGSKIVSFASKKEYEVVDIGLLCPDEMSRPTLHAGQVGYAVLGMKTVKEAFVGDTFFAKGDPVEPLPGFQKSKPMVFAGVFPVIGSEYLELKDAIDKLALNDSSLQLTDENSLSLGRGWRLGFLGSLHMEVFKERLQEEYSASLIFTAPTVSYQIEHRDGSVENLTSVEAFPEPDQMASVARILEPWVAATIVAPEEYAGRIMTLCMERRGIQKDISYLDATRVSMHFELPLACVITSFYNALKSLSSGYASLDYEEIGYVASDVVKLQALLNGKPVPDLSLVVHRSECLQVGRRLVKQLKKYVQRQLFEVALQAAIGGKVVARETIAATRKDVTAKCYGGDKTRRMKLLDRQKEGKKKLKMFGNVELDHDAFLAIVQSTNGLDPDEDE